MQETIDRLSAVLVTAMVVTHVAFMFMWDFGSAALAPTAATLMHAMGAAVMFAIAYVSYRRGISLKVMLAVLLALVVAAVPLGIADGCGSGPLAVGLLYACVLGGANGLGIVLVGIALAELGGASSRFVIVIGFVLASVVMVLASVGGWLRMPLVRPLGLVAFFVLALCVFRRLLRGGSLTIDPAQPARVKADGEALDVGRMLLSASSTALVTYVASVVYALAFGLVEAYVMQMAAPNAASPGALVAAWAIVLAVCALSLATFAVKNSMSLFNGLFLGICIASICAMPVALILPSSAGVLFSVSLATLVFMQIPTWTFLNDMARVQGVSPAFLFSFFPATFAFAHLCGTLVAHIFPPLVEGDPNALPVLIAVLVAAIAVGAMVALAVVLVRMSRQVPEAPDVAVGTAGEAASPAAPEERPADAFAAFCDAYGLSERERDIARLYASGRSVPVISEQLSIARSTVKTHISGIYGRVGIHTKQELIDAIAAFGDSTASR